MDATSQGLWSDTASQAAAAYGVPANIFSALINQESGWQPYALGSSGEVGFTQLMPNTAASLGVNAWDPISNLYGGASYLSSLFKKYGNWTDALAAYNAGTPSSNAGQSYAANILKVAGYTGTAATAATNAFSGATGSWGAAAGYDTSNATPTLISKLQDMYQAVFGPAIKGGTPWDQQTGTPVATDVKKLANDINANNAADAAAAGVPINTLAQAWGFLSSGQAVIYLVAGVGLIFVTYFGIKALFALHEGAS